MGTDLGIKRAVVAAAIGLAGVGVLGACDWDIATEEYSDATGIGQAFTSVRFADDSGNVTIRTGDSASVKRVVHYGDDKPGKDTFRVRGGVLELNACTQRNCSIDYEVTVPAATTVSGQNDSGEVDISGVAEANVRASSGNVTVRDVPGTVNVQASSGAVELSDIGGAVVAKADSGNITADQVDDDVTLKASSGAIEAHGIAGTAKLGADSGNITVELTEAGDVDADASSGAVDVTVPRGAYRISTHTGSGNVDSDVDNDADGEHALDLRTDSGNITISQA
jgi:DUF4097 and DUF4098 domain-containing protein YvlB